VGCGRRAPKADLIRFAAADGELRPDPDRSLPGRGAWLHRDAACWEAAVARRGFARTLRSAVRVGDQPLDWTY
jgi:uncharacterized protein